MTICQLTNAADDEPAGRSVSACARALSHAGNDVLLITPAEAAPGLPSGSPRFRRRWMPAAASFTGRGAAGAATEERCPRPVDLVHVHDPFLVGEEALRLATQSGIPLVFTVSLRYENPFPLTVDESRDLAAFFEKLEVCFANSCDLVVAATPALAIRLFEGGVLRPIHVVPAGEPSGRDEARAARLLELYSAAIRSRRARGPVRECAQSGRLRRELALAWEKIHPAGPEIAHRGRAELAPVRAGSVLPC
jgi:hypothetical protein